MAGTATTYLRTRMLQHVLGIAPFAAPAGVYIGLTNTLPTADVGGTEPSSAANYARRPFSAVMDDTGRLDVVENGTAIEFLAATAPWGVVGWFELWDAAIGGNRLFWGSLVSPADLITPLVIEVLTGDQVRVPMRAIQVQAI